MLIAIVTEIAAPVARMNTSGEAMKSSTVDLVVTGDERAAVDAAVNVLRHGQRVLVVLRGRDPCLGFAALAEPRTPRTAS